MQVPPKQLTVQLALHMKLHVSPGLHVCEPPSVVPSAAASVLAKVSRDRYMRKIAARHPEWDFDTNVGYSTPEHRAAIAQHGVSPLHRLSFQSIAYNQLALEG